MNIQEIKDYVKDKAIIRNLDKNHPGWELDVEDHYIGSELTYEPYEAIHLMFQNYSLGFSYWKGISLRSLPKDDMAAMGMIDKAINKAIQQIKRFEEAALESIN